MDSKDKQAAIKMYKTDTALLCFAQVALTIIILIMLFVVLGLTRETSVRTLIVVSGVILIIASITTVFAVIRHLVKNHLEINMEDIRQTCVLRENKGGDHYE